MKVIRNDVCYIETEDIDFIGKLSSNVIKERREKLYYSPFIKFEKYKKDECVEFFREQDSVLDYNTVCDLSSEQLEEKIDSMQAQLECFSKRVLDSTKVVEDMSITLDIGSLKHVLDSLKKYRDNRSTYDKEISNLSFGKIKRVPLNYVPVCTTRPPVARIQVPSSHMEALDRSIRSKCEQNARERIASEEAAKHYIVGVGTMDFYLEHSEKTKVYN